MQPVHRAVAPGDLRLPGIIMRNRLRFLCVLLPLVFNEVSAFMIRNKLLGKCLQVQDGYGKSDRVGLVECSRDSPLQDWKWLPESQALSNLHTGECLTAPRGEQYEGVLLLPCIEPAELQVDMDREDGGQMWSCSKKGHLTLVGNGLHLSASQDSTLVFLSKEHKQGSRWRTPDNQTVCSERDRSHHPQHYHTHNRLGASVPPAVLPSAISGVHGQTGPDSTGMDPGTELSSSPKSPADPTMLFFSMDYGMGWKITMLVLSSLALVLGTVILIVNVYSNRRKKVVCVLKSYSPREEMSQPGSPVPSERAPLTKHAMHLPHSSPSLHRGEILIEWKDGTVTPLYEG